MRRVVQLDSTGCGLACVAMIAGTSYSRVKSKAATILDNGSLRTDGPDLRKLLEAYKIDTGKRLVPFYTWENLPPLCILATNYSENTGYWHWVVFVRNKDDCYVLDPRRSIRKNKRRDFNRMTPTWYLKIG